MNTGDHSRCKQKIDVINSPRYQCYRTIAQYIYLQLKHCSCKITCWFEFHSCISWKEICALPALHFYWRMIIIFNI